MPILNSAKFNCTISGCVSFFLHSNNCCAQWHLGSYWYTVLPNKRPSVTSAWSPETKTVADWVPAVAGSSPCWHRLPSVLLAPAPAALFCRFSPLLLRPPSPRPTHAKSTPASPELLFSSLFDWRSAFDNTRFTRAPSASARTHKLPLPVSGLPRS